MAARDNRSLVAPPPKQKNTGLYVALSVAALVLVGGVVGSRFFITPPPPPPPPPPPTADHSVTRVLRFTEAYYHGVLDDGAKQFGVPPVTIDQMAQPLAHHVELDQPRTIAPGESIETERLKLTAAVEKVWATSATGQSVRADHLLLRIGNRTSDPLAYRVDTKVARPDLCRTMGAWPHDGDALDGNGQLTRTECLYHKGERLTVTHVETLVLREPLSYYYVSRIDPALVGLDPRTAAGHAPPKGKLCHFVPRREIETGGATWADVMDFYARHDCDEYSFFAGYKLRAAPGPLPARPPDETAGAVSPTVDGGGPR